MSDRIDTLNWFRGPEPLDPKEAFRLVSNLFGYIDQLEWNASHHTCPNCQQDCLAAESPSPAPRQQGANRG